LKAEPDEFKRADIFLEDAKRYINEDKARAVKRLGVNFLNFWRPWLSKGYSEKYPAASNKENIVYTTSYLPFFVFFLIGLFKAPWREPQWATIGAVMLYKMLANIPFYMIVRFREALFPLMLLVAVYGLKSVILEPRKSE
jgi:hypothetical protein